MEPWHIYIYKYVCMYVFLWCHCPSLSSTVECNINRHNYSCENIPWQKENYTKGGDCLFVLFFVFVLACGTRRGTVHLGRKGMTFTRQQGHISCTHRKQRVREKPRYKTYKPFPSYGLPPAGLLLLKSPELPQTITIREPQGFFIQTLTESLLTEPSYRGLRMQWGAWRSFTVPCPGAQPQPSLKTTSSLLFKFILFYIFIQVCLYMSVFPLIPHPSSSCYSFPPSFPCCLLYISTYAWMSFINT